MSSSGSAAVKAAQGRRAARRQLASTPGRLRLAATVLALGSIVFGVVAVRAAAERRAAVQRVSSTEHLLVAAVRLSASLSDAHAIAAFGFLRGTPERAPSLLVYDAQLRQASVGVSRLAGSIGASSGSEAPVRRITERLSAYAGLVATARAHNRQGFPVGSAYLRQASRTMREGMLPAARELYAIEADNLIASYRAGVSSWTWLVVTIAGCALLALLVATQVYLARTTRRILNLGLVAATALALGLVVWIVLAFAVQQRALAQAQRRGSDPVELLTAARILGSRAQSDESIALAARGGGENEPRLADVDRGFQAVTKPIPGLLDRAVAISGGTGASSGSLESAYAAYLQAHARVVERVKAGSFTKAVELAVLRGADGGPSTKSAADALNAAIDRQTVVAQRRFEQQWSDAWSALGATKAAIPAFAVLCALCALLGLGRRLEEYR